LQRDEFRLELFGDFRGGVLQMRRRMRDRMLHRRDRMLQYAVAGRMRIHDRNRRRMKRPLHAHFNLRDQILVSG